MRIIGGTLKQKRLMTPYKGSPIRPTSDRLRQTCFDCLRHASWVRKSVFDQAVVLDAFAGTGAWGLEALSRGATRAIFFDTSPEALTLIRHNIHHCGMGLRTCVEWMDATAPSEASRSVDLVFLDPPYGQGLIEKALNALKEKGWLDQGTYVIAEYDREETREWPDFFEVMDERIQGRGCLAMGRIRGS